MIGEFISYLKVGYKLFSFKAGYFCPRMLFQLLYVSSFTLKLKTDANRLPLLDL